MKAFIEGGCDAGTTVIVGELVLERCWEGGGGGAVIVVHGRSPYGRRPSHPYNYCDCSVDIFSAVLSRVVWKVWGGG